MAGQARHLKVKGGRFYARLAVPARLRQIIGETEFVVPLGGERRAAMKALPAAVATLQRQLDAAEGKTNVDRLDSLHIPITTQDYGRAVWARYRAILEADDAIRAAYPPAEPADSGQRVCGTVAGHLLIEDDHGARDTKGVRNVEQTPISTTQSAFLGQLPDAPHAGAQQIRDHIGRNGGDVAAFGFGCDGHAAARW